ncbi:tRNA (5-methylaminomethyl-2-thiouridine)(34)-methyltransferase MnmD [Methylotenera sp.]|uniref:tRNA (5-methylaminomethyl-2-thiouridine)(34)-methyltransferase MnmD n=1 Tax=Methylotenera sp. TaxID=2051956 RepID=UPI002488124E|nr:tRNA (5-methylaminomethyl-2-thiouridine)(34)-methyltransferase MnmD [Methylotenera sp.]MDI1300206.1 tRNA (5-methylaminomethyl-2-thiouridine)(34)-methyltransferase MnmD [Methylotenera sp.]
MQSPSNTANIEWRDGQPYASEFQDVYFSTDNGLLETDYVFLQGNDLMKRWLDAEMQTFIIAETGFGTGLNFLCAVNAWLATSPENATLHFISTEKYPLSLQDMRTALSFWPQLKAVSEPFLAQYESLINGANTIALYDNRVQLSLLIGDATTSLSKITSQVDAWFLDGFAPAKNRDMWQTELFQQMARLSKTSTTFATFTSAGDVRRGLINAGFNVTKRTGFGKKREMLIGNFIP